MENVSSNSQCLLEMEGFNVTDQSMYPLFFLLLFNYLLILIFNIGILVLITTERSLHQPMYLLFCNLPVNDLIGTTALMPRLMLDILSSKRYISYIECVVQAFCSHIFGSASHMILIVMALDRYVAICHPLRYNSIMTTSTVAKLSAFAWGVSLSIITVLFALTLRLSRCRSVIYNAYCDNASLFKLSCEDITVNNIYGLFITVLLHVSSMGSISITYCNILFVCFTTKNKKINSKALQTCATHLVLYLVMLCSGFLTVILHRYPANPDFRKLTGILFHVVPANVNPIVYGLNSNELRNKLVQIFL
ncbi:olfactory receptor 52N5-like [Lepisosteus oculatus]|uniref:olfactory receptor 52N5-like n=1 Tax=Lepisosteus oculatus TaxID=7918 RepID=UPI003714C40E